MPSPFSLAIVIPTYQREEVLLDTLHYVLELSPAADEIVVVDQTGSHPRHVEETLVSLEEKRVIRRVRLSGPSIPRAMNVGLVEAESELVLFLDDDLVPGEGLIAAHVQAHKDGNNLVAGQVLQPGETACSAEAAFPFQFNSTRKRYITEFMGGNFSIKRALALELGGFDENFVRVAYRFEAEFADRALAAGEKILFDPAAGIRHLKAARGGTRSYGEHLTTIRPDHAVGAYYYLLRSKTAHRRLRRIFIRPCRAIRTRHHLRKPWWIPLTLIAELLGFVWAVLLKARGPRLINCRK
jgi:GT2 family glycosyltransferase